MAQRVRPPNFHEIFRQNIEQRQQLNRLKLSESHRLHLDLPMVISLDLMRYRTSLPRSTAKV